MDFVPTTGIKTLRHILLISLLSLLLFKPFNSFSATASGRVKGATTLEAAVERQLPQAYVKENRLIIFYRETEGKVLSFKARWKKSPIQGYEFVQYVAELTLDLSPPDLSRSKIEEDNDTGRWRKAVALDNKVWTNLVNRIAERLTPPEPNSAIYFNFLFREVIMFRDATGKIHATAPETAPDDIEIKQRYGVREFSEIAAKILAGELPEFNQDRLVLFVLETKRKPVRFLLIDSEQKICVALYEPHTGSNPYGKFPFDASIQVLSSLIFESHLISAIKNPFSTICRLLNTGWQLSASLIHLRLPQLSSDIPPLSYNSSMDLTEWEQWLDKKTHRKAQEANIKFLIDGESYFPVLIDKIKSATNKVQIRVSIFDNDDVAVDVADLLKQRSFEIKVEVLLDLLSTQTSSRSLPETPMREGFIQPSSIRRYLQKDSKVRVRAFLNPWFTSDHSKLVIIDGHTAFIGGMNIGREYRYEWHDLMAEVSGPIVETLKFDFEKAFAHAGALGDLGCFFTFFGKQPESGKQLKVSGEKYALARVLHTKTADLELKTALFEAIKRAQSYIYIENSYLYDSSFATALVKARRRGVDVRVILPDRCDTPGGNSGIYITANYLFNNGVSVYIYPGMTHVKAALIDGWACFGSANFNRLSLRRNQEINLATSDPDIANQLKQQLFEKDFNKSHLLKEPIQVNWTDYIAESILNQF
ncbi:MAG: phospholipase D-like domain-containing protein [Verrucomicrobiia bacterium]|jgi:phosphatidylserine/phosphatidylglycerophosphate/cardiolipin synthase-like enzyme